MAVRLAQARDIPKLLMMFSQLLEFLEKSGNYLYTQDRDRFTGGIMEFLGEVMQHQFATVLVKVDDEDKVRGFLVGQVVHYPKFFEHWCLGEILWMYPFGFTMREVLDEFRAWAKEQGATGEACYATPTHTISIKAMEREGLRLGLYHLYRGYEQ